MDVSSLVHRASLPLRKHVRRYLARPTLQRGYRWLYRLSLAGMNYGGAASTLSAGDQLALERVRRMRRAAPPVIFDVGANTGSYLAQALRILGEDARIFAFEPGRSAFEQLARAFGRTPNVSLTQAGVGVADTTTTLWADVPGSVLASTYADPGSAGMRGEPIQLVTLDGFCDRHAIPSIDLLKLDIEGGEVDALRGASRLLQGPSVHMIQFEFGQPSLRARTYFADLFDLLAGRFQLFRVLPSGFEPIAAYHETLEVFMSTNYLAVSRARLAEFRS